MHARGSLTGKGFARRGSPEALRWRARGSSVVERLGKTLQVSGGGCRGSGMLVDDLLGKRW
jgi:hypothetical protein